MMFEIHILPDQENLGVKFQWGHSDFDDLKQICKMGHLIWTPEIKSWIGTKKQIYSLIPFFENTLEQQLPQSIKDFVTPVQETSFTRSTFLPEVLKAEPIGEFQKQGIIRGIRQNRLLYAWEMGLGKTYTVISVINHLWAKGTVDRVMVIAPSESVYNFRREFLKFGSFSLKEEEIYVANVDNRTPLEFDPKIIIMTYRTFLMLSDDAYFVKNKKRSKSYRTPTLPIDSWGTNRAIILDESHMIKSRTARQSKALSLHKQFFNYRYLLSGTPDPNGVDGYFNQIEFLDEGAIGKDYYSWLRDVANIGNRWSDYGINYFYPEKVKEFIDSISFLVSREFTAGNLELPELLIKKIYTEFSPKQEKIYQDLVSYTLNIIKEENGVIIPKKVQEKFPFIMQAIENPCMLVEKIDGTRSPGLANQLHRWKFGDHSKLEPISSMLENYIDNENRKVILWSGHPLTMDQLLEFYGKYNPLIIHGLVDMKGMDKEHYRDEVLTEFRSKKDRPLLIASYLVLSQAVTIVEATRSIYFDRSWNYTYWAQSIKRSHRIGQEQSVIASPVLIEHSLDERLDKNLDRKEGLNNNLFNADVLTKEQWRDIFLGT